MVKKRTALTPSRILTPEQANLQPEGNATKYIDPNTFDSNETYVGKYYVQESGESRCNGKLYTIYKVYRILTPRPWKNVPKSMKGVQNPAKDDEQFVGEFVLGSTLLSAARWNDNTGDHVDSLNLTL
tara:strand:- start:194 stop:574 length:381 start_codon:yes stop_codon:yes gene_type:complete